jgi:hypothetical protein
MAMAEKSEKWYYWSHKSFLLSGKNIKTRGPTFFLGASYNMHHQPVLRTVSFILDMTQHLQKLGRFVNRR